MFYRWMLIACFAASPLAAETIGNVEYQLPNQGKGWKVAQELKGSHQSTTIIYVPENSGEAIAEFFGAHVNDLPTADTFDAPSITKRLEQQYPGKKITVTVIEKDDTTALFEWSVAQGDKEELHGWSRVFSTPDGTAVLTYQTEETDKLDKAREIWPQVLKNAKLTK